MTYSLALIIALGLVIAWQLYIRTNGAVVFFSLCAGYVLSLQFASDASLISGTYIKDVSLNRAVVSITLLVLPAILSAVFLRKTVTGGQHVINLVPAAAVAGLLALLAIPMLPYTAQTHFTDTVAWQALEQFKPIIIVGGVASSVVMIFATSHNKHKFGKKHK